MRFLIFNIAVVAAICYILYERGDLEGTVFEDLAEKAETMLAGSSAAKPTATAASEKRLAESNPESLAEGAAPALPDALPAQLSPEPTREPASAPSPQPVPQSLPQSESPVPSEPLTLVPAEQGAAKVEVASVETEVAAEPAPGGEVAPAAIAEPVAPEVAARRAAVLGPTASDGAERERSAMTSSERQENLRHLAEEMEYLSIEMIYR